MRCLAVIPARGGSKRIPQKNLKSFMGKPMIQYSIEAAITSSLFDDVIVSTDDEQIKKIGVSLGARVPFMRSPKLSDDRASLADVLLDSLDFVTKEDAKKFDAVCLILATAPFIEVRDLERGLEILESSEAPAVVPLTSFPFPIFRAQKIKNDGRMEMVWPEHELKHSTEFPETFHDVGQFYWLRVTDFMSEKKIYAKGAMPLLIPRHRVQDIDTQEDWDRAELIFKALHFPAKMENR